MNIDELVDLQYSRHGKYSSKSNSSNSREMSSLRELGLGKTWHFLTTIKQCTLPSQKIYTTEIPLSQECGDGEATNGRSHRPSIVTAHIPQVTVQPYHKKTLHFQVLGVDDGGE